MLLYLYVCKDPAFQKHGIDGRGNNTVIKGNKRREYPQTPTTFQSSRIGFWTYPSMLGCVAKQYGNQIEFNGKPLTVLLRPQELRSKSKNFTIFGHHPSINQKEIYSKCFSLKSQSISKKIKFGSVKDLQHRIWPWIHVICTSANMNCEGGFSPITEEFGQRT